jgi:hypothetical protein
MPELAAEININFQYPLIESTTMSDHPLKITDEDIQAVIDGYGSPHFQETVKALIARNPAYKARYLKLRRQRDLLRLWYSANHLNDNQPIADEDQSETASRNIENH